MSAHRTSHRPVRPRWVWAGTSVLVAGTCIAAYGVDVLSWRWCLAGAAVMVTGGGTALASGVLRDVQGAGGVRAELRDVRAGNVHQGVARRTPPTPAARSRSRELDRRRVALEQAARAAPRPALVRPAAGALLLVTLFLVVSQWELYPIGIPGQDNAGRSLGCAIVWGLAALRVLTAEPGQTHRLSAGLAALAGLFLLLNGLLASHDRLSTEVAEVVCGALAVVAAAVTSTREQTSAVRGRRSAPGERPPSSAC